MSSTLPNQRRPFAVATALALGASGAQAGNLTITSGGDAGTASDCTLRQAIASANNDSPGASACAAGSGVDTIVFDASLVNATITLSHGQLLVSSPVTIIGSGQTINANGASRVFYINSATLTASSLTLTGGAAAGASGGGVFNNAGTVTFTNSVISGNGAGLWGGGLHATAGTLTLTNSTVSGNTCGFGGAGVDSVAAAVEISDSTISGNTAGTTGGGVYAIFDTLTFTNTTITGNHAGAGTVGGGIYSESSTATLTNTTVSGNSAGAGGGVFVFGNAGAANTAIFINTILSNNAGGDCAMAGSNTIIASHTLVADASSACGITAGANNIVGQDPLLGPLADNGGPTQTIAPDAVSPALNAGSVALALFGNDTLNYDQRGFGFPRTLNAMVDMGAYQHQGDRVFADGSEPEP